MTARPTPARTAVVHPDADTLAATTAARLLVRLVDVQSLRTPAHVVLTGGTVGIRVLAEMAGHPALAAVDWTGVHLWWGDERFLPAGHPDRNETQARDALLDHLVIPAQNVHPVPASDAPGISSPEDAAAAYAAELAAYAPSPVPEQLAAPGSPAPAASDDAGPAVPAFDVLLLGMGPDGHVASLFPGHAALEVLDRTVVGVHGSPKPPPERVSLTFPAIESAEEVWVVAAGSEKAAAVARALGGDATASTPAAAAVGRARTRWLIDAAAAG